MIDISIHKEKNYPVSAAKIKSRLKKFLTERGIVSDAEVAVAIVSKEKVQQLAIKYLGESQEEARDHPVLSFPVSEMTGLFIFPPKKKKVVQLGDIVISYDESLEEVKKTGRLIDDVVYEWIEHGALHLLGIHHD